MLENETPDPSEQPSKAVTTLFSAPRPDRAEERPVNPAEAPTAPPGGPSLLFQAPDPTLATRPPKSDDSGDVDHEQHDEGPSDRSDDADSDDHDGSSSPRRRKRSRGGRRRRRGGDSDDAHENENDSDGTDDSDDSDDSDDAQDNGGSKRRRRRVRQGESATAGPDDPEGTVVKVREGRSAEDEISSVSGSTRLEAKKQRRREGREAGRRRAPIVTESEFLARRESVKREMVIRQSSEFSQIAVLEDDVLVEHYVSRESQTSIIGNVYLGKVQNVLPSMEAAFVDIGQGRNAVLYAGEVDWSTLGNGKPRKIEEALTPGQTILVQVSKDPIGHKGARLTSQISLPGRFLVLVPGGQTSGISRKLPDTERARLKSLLKEVVADNAGVIVRTAAEGATEDQLTRDVAALNARWEDIQSKLADGKSPQALYAEPDLMIKVIRDLFNEDFTKLIVDGDDAWDNIHGYIGHVAPDLIDRLERWEGDNSAFDAYRIDEQIAKALDHKVWLPSGGSLIIDRTEAMTVVDVNTGKFTGSGGNLEETVTKNNLEAAEEIVRQLRLRDIGGIIVIDFIDMVLENNRDLVLRRLVECLGRDRTRHQVAEVTSLGLVQMTRKRIGTGLLESFATPCEHCKGTGEIIHSEPIEPKRTEDAPRRNRRARGGKGKKGDSDADHSNGEKPSDKAVAVDTDPDSGEHGDGNAQGKAESSSASRSGGKKQTGGRRRAKTDDPASEASTTPEAVADPEPDSPSEASTSGAAEASAQVDPTPVLTDEGSES